MRQRLLAPLGIVDVAPCPTAGPGGRPADSIWNTFVDHVNVSLDGWSATPRQVSKGSRKTLKRKAR